MSYDGNEMKCVHNPDEFAYCSANCAYTTLKILAHDWKQTCVLMCTFISSQSLLDRLKWVNVLLKLSEILQDKNVRHIRVLVCCSDVNLDIFGFRTEPVSRLNSRMQIYLPVSYSSTSLRQVLKHLVLFLYLYLYLYFYFHFIHLTKGSIKASCPIFVFACHG